MILQLTLFCLFSHFVVIFLHPDVEQIPGLSGLVAPNAQTTAKRSIFRSQNVHGEHDVTAGIQTDKCLIVMLAQLTIIIL